MAQTMRHKVQHSGTAEHGNGVQRLSVPMTVGTTGCAYLLLKYEPIYRVILSVRMQTQDGIERQQGKRVTEWGEQLREQTAENTKN